MEEEEETPFLVMVFHYHRKDKNFLRPKERIFIITMLASFVAPNVLNHRAVGSRNFEVKL